MAQDRDGIIRRRACLQRTLDNYAGERSIGAYGTGVANALFATHRDRAIQPHFARDHGFREVAVRNKHGHHHHLRIVTAVEHARE